MLSGRLWRSSLVSLVWALILTISNAADPPLLPGNPLPGITHVEFSGVGGTNTPGGGAQNALSAFEAAIGGVSNTAAAPGGDTRVWRDLFQRPDRQHHDHRVLQRPPQPGEIRRARRNPGAGGISRGALSRAGGHERTDHLRHGIYLCF